MGATQRRVDAPSRMHEATEATPLMAAYFLGALRDQSSRANAFHRQLRWQRMRVALAPEGGVGAAPPLPAPGGGAASRPAVAAAVAELPVRSTEERPAPPQAAAS